MMPGEHHKQERPHLDAIPQELKELPQWVLWDWERLGDKWTKVPKKLGGGNAASDNPSEWSAFEDVADCERIGFMFTPDDPYCGIDLDDCIDEQGELNSEAEKIIDAFGSYAEVSPSGAGVKLWARGSVPGPRRKNTKRGMEMYHSRRFFTVTGHRLSEVQEISDGQKQIDKLYGWLFADEPDDHSPAAETGAVDATDADILSKAFRAENSGKFLKLWNGETGDYPSGSEADLALATMLAFWTGPDEGRIERMFSDSVLGQREKWQKRTGYRRATVARALKGKTEFYDWHTGGGATLTITGHIAEEPRVSEKAESYEVPPFPVEAMPQSTRRFISEAATAIGAPADFLGLPVLSVLAQAVGASRVVKIKSSWTESSTLFCAIVAEPGTKKTPTAKAAAKPVWDRHFELEREYKKAHREYEEKMRQHEADAKNAKQNGVAVPEEPKEPKPERVMTVDTTVEALIQILADNPRGVMVQRDELTGWIRALDQYKGGKGSDKQHWLSLWSSAPISVDRKSQHQAVSVENPSVTLYGGIQPNMLTELGPTEEEGLIERFLFAYPEYRRQPFSWEEISQDAMEEYQELYEVVARLRMAPTQDDEGNYREAPAVVKMLPEAQQLFATYADTIAWEIEEPGFPARLKGAYSKLEAYLGRIALILAVARCADERELERVETQDVEAAWTLVRYFGAHARKVYGGLGSATGDDLFAGSLWDFLEDYSGEWEGEPAELLEEMEARDLEEIPESAEALSKALTRISKRYDRLSVERKKKRQGEKVRRILKIEAQKTVHTVNTVNTDAETGPNVDGVYGVDGFFNASSETGYVSLEDSEEKREQKTVHGVHTVHATEEESEEF